jgi:hypothetical protein
MSQDKTIRYRSKYSYNCSIAGCGTQTTGFTPTGWSKKDKEERNDLYVCHQCITDPAVDRLSEYRDMGQKFSDCFGTTEDGKHGTHFFTLATMNTAQCRFIRALRQKTGVKSDMLMYLTLVRNKRQVSERYAERWYFSFWYADVPDRKQLLRQVYVFPI